MAVEEQFKREEKKADEPAKESREETKVRKRKSEKEISLENWVPKTETGKLVRAGTITSYDQIIAKHLPVLESEVVDYLIPDLEEKIVDFKKTTKVRRSGRQFAFRIAVLVGDKRKFIGIGIAKDKEKWSAIRKATKNAKLNLMTVRKGCGSWECVCGLGHSVPFAVEGKSASVRVKFLPAPKGTGLVAGDNIKDVLKFVGIEDVWTRTSGSTATKLNFVRAAIDSLSKTVKMKISDDLMQKVSKKVSE